MPGVVVKKADGEGGEHQEEPERPGDARRSIGGEETTHEAEGWGRIRVGYRGAV